MFRKGKSGDGEKDAKAVALQYERERDPAPRVAAKGRGHIAEQIIEIAEDNGIPVKEDSDLVEVLSVLEVDSFIPLEAYEAVAEILSFIYRKNAERSTS